MRGTFLRVPILSLVVFGGLYWGPPIWGNYQIDPDFCISVVGLWFIRTVDGKHPA